MELVARTCKCGCGQQWRTLETSKWWYWDLKHAIQDGHFTPDEISKLKIPKEPFPEDS